MINAYLLQINNEILHVNQFCHICMRDRKTLHFSAATLTLKAWITCLFSRSYIFCCLAVEMPEVHLIFTISPCYILQLVEIVMENGPDVLGIPTEVRKEIVLNLHEASVAMDPPEDWEGAMPDQLLLQLASTWGINPQQHAK